MCLRNEPLLGSCSDGVVGVAPPTIMESWNWMVPSVWDSEEGLRWCKKSLCLFVRFQDCDRPSDGVDRDRSEALFTTSRGQRRDGIDGGRIWSCIDQGTMGIPNSMGVFMGIPMGILVP